jgi:aminopeptidase N
VSRLGWAEQTSDSYFDKLLRPTILAMAANSDNQDVINNINEAYAQAKSIEDIPSNIRNVVLSTIARYGSKPEFDQMFSWLSLATAPENTVVLAHAMTNFRKPAEIKRALYLIKSPSVRLQDVHYWIVYSLANPVARGYAWQWLKDNWQWLKDTAGGDHGFSHLPMYVARAFSDVSFIEPYQSFFKKVYEPSLDRTIKQGLETIKMQAAWRKRDEQALLDWLATRKF